VVVDKVGHPLKVIATEGTEPDYKRALELVASLDATCVLADKAYDADEIIFSHAALFPIISPKINRKSQRPYDKNIYKKRHISLLCFCILCSLHLSFRCLILTTCSRLNQFRRKK
jgi:transposase